jgi:hypothetical protein
VKPTRTAAEIEADLAIIKRHREAFDRLVNQRRTKEEEDLDRELLLAIGRERAALEERMDPPKERVFPQALLMTRDQRLAKAAQLRSDPRFYRGPGYPHPDGVHGALSKDEHETMVRIHQELTEIDVAATSGSGV